MIEPRTADLYSDGKSPIIQAIKLSDEFGYLAYHPATDEMKRWQTEVFEKAFVVVELKPYGSSPKTVDTQRNEECMSDDPVLIVDDVWTTGDSWNAIAKPFLDNGIPVRGIVIFTRSGNLPPNVKALIYVQDLHEYLNT